MQSKRSFFNPTLFGKNLSRSWPMWGGLAALGALIPLYLLLHLLQTPAHNLPDAAEFAQMLYSAAVYFSPAFLCGYAILVAMVVWSYLYSARSVGMLHTLPVDRTGLFITGTLSGLAMLLIPYAVVGGFMIVLSLCWGFFSATAVVNTILSVLLLALLFFGMATFCAMITGNIFALPVFYAVLNFAAPAMDFLVMTLARSFMVGLRNDYSGAVDFLSPVVEIYQNFDFSTTYGDALPGSDRLTRAVVLEGFGTVAIYGLVGLVLLVLAWVIYRLRASERAGDVVAFRWLRPVFRFGVALVTALTGGQALYNLFWQTLFYSGEYAKVLPMAGCMAITGVVGYFAASMLLDKTLRVFRKNWVGAVAAMVLAAALCFAVDADFFGVESRVPAADEIEYVRLSGGNMLYSQPNLYPDKDPELVEEVRRLHQAIVDDIHRVGDYAAAREAEDRGDEWYSHYVRIDYYLNDGTTVKRTYDLYLLRSNWQAGESIEGAFRDLITGGELQMNLVECEENAQLEWLYIYNHEAGEKDVEYDTQAVYAALLADARAGRLYDYDPFDEYQNETYPVTIDMEFSMPDDNSTGSYVNRIYDYRTVEVRPTMTETIRVLVEEGFLTEEEVEKWDFEMDLKYSK